MPRPTGPGGSLRLDARTPLRVELLEDRATPSTGPVAAGDFHPVVVAGDPNGTEARGYADKDSPDNRIDPNSPDSPYAGVGSIQVKSRLGTFIGTGAVVGSKYVVTAAHVVDLNNDGKVTSADKTQGVYFQLNLGGTPIRIAVTRFTIHPDYNGFGNPAVNDDVAILTLAKPVPAGVPVYGLPTVDLVAGTQLTMVGYGRSGDPVNGYTIPASPTIKRVGSNVADAFYGQDDPGRPEANEVFRFDFDGPTENGPLGGPTLGNTVETTLGGGDSGCPAFAGGILSGIGTFTQGDAPHFGSMGGGVNVFWYTGWINSILLGASAAYRLPTGRSAGGDGVNVGATPVHGELSAAGLTTGEPARDGAASWAVDESEAETPSYIAAPADEVAVEWLVSAPVAGDGVIETGSLVTIDLVSFSPDGLPAVEE
ncbi:MAG TPA: trypsin-like serine protease [Gemmataceae bacterium]|nr:trypsin-like serine protease [Gemmataceae bacterium]